MKSTITGLFKVWKDPKVKVFGERRLLEIDVNTHYYAGKDDAGNPRYEPNWYTIMVWGDRADRLKEKIKKGSQLYVSGQDRQRKWGENNERVSFEIDADTIHVLSWELEDAKESSKATQSNANSNTHVAASAEPAVASAASRQPETLPF